MHSVYGLLDKYSQFSHTQSAKLTNYLGLFMRPRYFPILLCVLPRLHFEEIQFDQIVLNLVAKCSIYGETRKMKKTVNIYLLSFEISRF